MTNILRAKLMHDKRTFRDIEILSDATLMDLAEAILDAFEFEDHDHLFGFFDNMGRNYLDSNEKYELNLDMDDSWGGMDSGMPSEDVEETLVGSVFDAVKHKMQFVFDYGDEWRFEVEMRNFGNRKKSVKYPRILTSKGEAPEQYPEWDENAEW
ncbi:MAG: hypothetical protein HQL69_24565 [Magnetococcales bacterium]|nr:hypothetical protein [Magnetococcales bacterium]